MTEQRRGLLLFAHGARDSAWALPFEAVARQCSAQQPDCVVTLAFLEFMQPDLVTAGTALVEQGCQAIDVVPLFLGTGGHVRKDIPRLLGELEVSHPQVVWHLRPPIGESLVVIDAMARVALDRRAPP